MISQDDTGKTGTVVLGTLEKPKRSLQGKIIRVFMNNNVRVAHCVSRIKLTNVR